MSMQPADWALFSVQALRESGSWTGRVHVQKLIFCLDALGLTHPPFQFRLYHYGPYSRDLDDTFSELEADGFLLRTYPKPGYGPQYSVTVSRRESPETNEERAIRRVAVAFGERSSQELERIATCLWAMRREGLSQEPEIVDRVMELKPRFDRATISQSLREARKLEAQTV